ncbi:MAG: response regulator [Thermodesulfobacteriota bacterium]|nr:response regulator [Thermodesulfobacteriota bacterium]
MLKILIVDDSRSARLLIESHLVKYGPCDHAAEGKEAMDLFKSALENDGYDLILMDIEMPEMDGHEAVKRIVEIQDDLDIPEDKRPKIVMVSSRKDPSDMMKAQFEHGADMYITKPFTEKTLIESLINLELLDNPISEPEE